MRSLRYGPILAAVALFLIGFGQVVLVLESPSTHSNGAFAAPGVYASYLLFVGWGFAGTGLYAWTRRSRSTVGPLMTAVGCAWLLRGLEVSSNSALFTAGNLLAPLAYALLTHLLLAFPHGRLETRSQRLLAAVAYVNVTVLQVAAFLVTDTRASYAACEGCPPNPIEISGSAAVHGAIITLQELAAVAVLVGLVLVLTHRWRKASAGQRRSLSPILTAGAAMLFFLAAAMVAATLGAVAVADASLIAALTVFASVPFAFLMGLLRLRFGEAEAVTAVVSKLGQSSGQHALRDALAEALDDPLLELAYWVPEISDYVDSEGRRVALPPSEGPMFATRISHEGDPVAAVIHDASLVEEGNLVQAVAAAVALTLKNERLDAELRVRLAELRASRARIVQAGDEQRRHIERDLHDGAQQRLMALGINLRLARDRVDSDPREATELLDISLHELGEAIAELRELARGIHPTVLTNRGLGAALNGLASRSSVPVQILQTPAERLPPPIESAVYFVVAEALTNAARYASAREVTICTLHQQGQVQVTVSDDGIGGADPARGSGLRGLHDRIAALEGQLELASKSGQGTTLRVTLPCG